MIFLNPPLSVLLSPMLKSFSVDTQLEVKKLFFFSMDFSQYRFIDSLTIMLYCKPVIDSVEEE